MLRIQKAPPNLTTEGHTHTSSPEYKISHILYIKKGSWFPLPPESSQENGNSATRYIQVLFVCADKKDINFDTWILLVSSLCSILY